MSSAPTFLRTVSSVSPKSWRRSVWPTITCWQPTSASMGADTSPVNAPCFSQWTFCAATSMAEPLAAWTAAASAVNGGATATWTFPARSPSAARSSRTSAVVSATVLCIFQLPR